MDHGLKKNSMQFTAAQIAMLINGKLEGNAAATVASFGKIEEAREGQLSFLANPKYEEFLYSTRLLLLSSMMPGDQRKNKRYPDPCSGCIQCFCHPYWPNTRN
jgi:hypothetical protein